MVGGATPPADGNALILSLRRMNRIRSISTDANQAVCEAGVILSTLHDAAAAGGRPVAPTQAARIRPLGSDERRPAAAFPSAWPPGDRPRSGALSRRTRAGRRYCATARCADWWKE